MRVTNVRVDKYHPQESGICADCSITLDNCFQVHQVHVINGEKGLFVAFPNTGDMKKYANSKQFFDLVHPTSSKLRKHIEEEVLSVYNTYEG